MLRLCAILSVLTVASCTPDLFELIEVEAPEAEPVHVEVGQRRLTEEERAEAEARLRAKLRSIIDQPIVIREVWCGRCDEVVDPGCVFGNYCEHIE
jgi:hypothetical protein